MQKFKKAEGPEPSQTFLLIEGGDSHCLYVTAMGWPEDGRLIIKSLAKGNKDFKRGISSVTLLGYGKLKARQTAEGLEVSLPKPCNKIAPVLKIAK